MSLRFEDVTKRFGRRTVLAGVTLDIGAGKQVILRGENGAGKTTMLRIAAGLLNPSSGAIDCPRTAFVPQDAPVYPELTPAEHLQWWARIYGNVPATVPGLGALLHRPASHLSRGQRQRLHLAMAFSTGAFLLLDEPTTALDDAGQEWFLDQLATHPGGALIASHEALPGRTVTLAGGRL